MQWIEEGLRLAVVAVLAAVRASKDDDEEMDWSKLRITETPEAALEKARKKAAENKGNATDLSG